MYMSDEGAPGIAAVFDALETLDADTEDSSRTRLAPLLLGKVGSSGASLVMFLVDSRALG